MPEVKIIRIYGEEYSDNSNSFIKETAVGITNWDTVTNEQLKNLRNYITEKNYRSFGERFILVVKDQLSIQQQLSAVKDWVLEADKAQKIREEKEKKRQQKAEEKKKLKADAEKQLFEQLKKKYA